MNPLLYLTFLTLAGAPVAALAQDTTYLNRYSRETTASKAAYSRTKTKVNEGWQVTDHYLSGVDGCGGILYLGGHLNFKPFRLWPPLHYNRMGRAR